MKYRIRLGLLLLALPAVLWADEYDCIITPSSSGGTVRAVRTGDDSFDLTAVPADGWTFVQWDDGETDNPRSVSATDATDYEAVFEDNRNGTYTPKYDNPAIGGGVSAAAGECSGDFVLTATPPNGYTFVGWSDGNTDNPRNVTVDPSKPKNTFSAVFERPTYKVLSTGEGGEVWVKWDDRTCQLKLIGIPSDGWTFVQWNDGNTDNPRVITSIEETYTATFANNRAAAYEPKYDNPAIGGSVIAVAGECPGDFVLTATPPDGYAFMSWNDGNMDNPRTISVDPAKAQNTYSAVFERPSYTALVTGDGGEIWVHFDESTCQMKLIALPNDGWEFEQWSDGNTDNPRSVASMEETYTATFTDNRAGYYTAKCTNPEVGGTVSAVATGECPGDFILTATPTLGYAFVSWLDGNTDNPRTVSVDPSQKQNIYEAHFVRPEYSATYITHEGGIVRMQWNEAECQRVLTAIPSDGYAFSEWNDGVTDNPRLITAVDEENVYTATFINSRCSFYHPKYNNPTFGGTVSVEDGECVCDRILHANPESGYLFIGWNDGNTDNPRTITIDDSKNQNIYTAYFERPQYKVISTGEGGSTFVHWDEENCELQIHALEEVGWEFERWSDGNTDNPRIVTTALPTFTAIYTQRQCAPYVATYDNPDHGGTVAAAPGECECDRVLTATPEEGWSFCYWEDGSTINPRNVTIDIAEHTYHYTATFAPKEGTVDGWSATDMIVRTKKFDLTGTTSRIYTGGTQRATDLALTEVDKGYWSIPASLNTYAGQSLHLVFFDACDKPVATLDTVVPYVITADANITVVPDNADVQVVSGTLTVNSDKTIAALDIYPGAKTVVPEGSELNVEAIYMRANAMNKTYPQLVANGAINNASDSIYYDYALDYANFYPLAVPYEVLCSAIRTHTGKQASYEVQWYNGEDRACNASGWNVLNDTAAGAKLNAGQGYIVFAVPYKWNGTRQSRVTVRFPMKADLTEGEKQKSTPISLYGNGGTNTSNRNWNFIGNPYLADYRHGDDARLMVGTYDPNICTPEQEIYTYINDDIRYVTSSTDGFQTYSQTRVVDKDLLAFNAYFIQAAATGDLIFTLSQRAQNAPRRVQSTDMPQEVAFGVVLSSANQKDYTGLLYGETFTPEYEMNADLVKLYGSTPVFSLYSLADTEERAFNALALDAIKQPVPLGFKNAQTGEWVFAFDDTHYDASMLEAVMLTDYETGRVVNLLEQDYHFTNYRAADNTRFVLHAVLAPRISTGVDNRTVNSLQPDGVYDLLGRRVSPDMLQQGVYVIIENGQSRKEVVR